jgi:hypothetical protein
VKKAVAATAEDRQITQALVAEPLIGPVVNVKLLRGVADGAAMLEVS